VTEGRTESTKDLQLAEASAVIEELEKLRVPDPRNLYQRLAAVMASVQRMAKLGKSPQLQYDYVREADVLEWAQKVLPEHGIAWEWDVVEEKMTERETEKRGKGSTYTQTAYYTRVTLTYSFINIDDPGDRAIHTIVGR